MLDAVASLGGQPPQELHVAEAFEGYPHRGRVVFQLDEHVYEDQLCQDEEVIEGAAHAEKERRDSEPQRQNGTAFEEVSEVPHRTAVVDVVVISHLDVAWHFLSHLVVAGKRDVTVPSEEY